MYGRMSRITPKRFLIPLFVVSFCCVLGLMKQSSSDDSLAFLHQRRNKDLKVGSNVIITFMASVSLVHVQDNNNTDTPAVVPIMEEKNEELNTRSENMLGKQNTTEQVSQSDMKGKVKGSHTSETISATTGSQSQHTVKGQEENHAIHIGPTVPEVPSEKHPPTKVGSTALSPPKLHVCGHDYREFSNSLFPDRKREKYRVKTNATNQDILMVGSHWCPQLHQNAYPGLVFFVDAENGASLPIQPQSLTYYLGPTKPSSPVNASMEYFFAALSSLYYPYSANDLLKPRNTMISSNFLIYMNSHAVDFREEAFDRLVDLAMSHGWTSLPVAAGACHGNYPALSEHAQDDHKDKYTSILSRMSPYRFALVMENSNVPGYVTEKIVNAFLSSTVPIYYGTTEIFKLFNKDAFIYYNISHPHEALDRIAYLETNRNAYVEVLQQPILANGSYTLEEYFSLTKSVGRGKLMERIRQWLLDGLPS